jgi:hypothetical protein
MRDEKRYEIENLPITQQTYSNLSQDGIDLIGTIGRMMKVQDEVIADTMAEMLESVYARFDKRISASEKRYAKQIKALSDKIDCMGKDMTFVKEEIKKQDARITVIEGILNITPAA